MKRFVLALAAMVLPVVMLVGCDMMNPAKSEGDSPNLQPIRYTYNNISTGEYRDMVVDARGDAHIVITKGSGPGDVMRLVGQITPEERGELLMAFKGWKKLEKFYPTDVSPQFEITYGGHAVITSNLEKVPQNFLQAKGELDKIAATLLQLYQVKSDKEKAATTVRAMENAATQANELPSALPVAR